MISRTAAFRCTIVAFTAYACGKPAQMLGDAAGSADTAGASDAASTDASIDAAMDAWTDASEDAAIGPLTPDPVDPTSAPCSGLLGFPGPGMVPFAPSPGEIFVVDADGDGKDDLLLPDGQDVVIARGNGDATFEVPSPFSALANGWGFRLAQLDADATPDLVFLVANGSTFEIRAALNVGSGPIGATQQLYSSTSLGFSQIEVADVNADGKQDILGLQASNGTVGVLISMGSAFSAPLLYTVGSENHSYAMAVGDLTGDGYPDVIETDRSHATVIALVNNGDGTLASPITYPTPSAAAGLVLVDANEDGALDVVVGTRSLFNAQISVLLNQGDGTLGTATSYSLGPSNEARKLVAADVDGDGHVDIAAMDWPGMGASLFLGSGTGQFATPLFYPNFQPTSIELADLQGDDRPEMVLLNGLGATVYLNSGTSSPFEARSVYDFDTSISWDEGPHTMDVNGDGRLDLLAMTKDAPSAVMLRLATGGGTFGPVASYPALPARHAVLADIDNDARPDLVLIGTYIQTLLNNADGTLTPTPPNPLPDDASEIEFADIDGDGIRDAVIGHVGDYPSYASEVRFHRGNGHGAFTSGVSLWTGTKLGGLAVVDLDNDGWRDLVIGSYSNGFKLEILHATGNGGYAPPLVVMTSSLPRSRLFARDIDGDGDADIFGPDGDGVVVMLGDGMGALGAPIRTATPISVSDAAFADFDGDGHLDAVATGLVDGPVAVLLGNGDGTFRARVYDSGLVAARIALGDIDEDGRVDMLTTGYARSDSEVGILFGRCL